MQGDKIHWLVLHISLEYLQRIFTFLDRLIVYKIYGGWIRNRKLLIEISDKNVSLIASRA